MNKKKLGMIIGIVVIAVGATIITSKLGKKETNDVVSTKTINIAHDAGETEVPINPEKVVTLSYSTLDILDEMDLENKIVGTAKSGLPSYLEEYNIESVEDLGGLKEFNIEKINELQPDLIIIEGRQAESYEELSKIAPTIQLGNDYTDFLGSLERNVSTLGTIFDKGDFASQQLTEVKKRIELVSKKVRNENMNGIAMMVTDGSMSVYGNGSRFSILFNDFGFEPADLDIEVSNHGQNISYEYLLDKNPNYLFVIDKANATGSVDTPAAAKEILSNDLVKTTDAYKKNNIIYLNGPAWYVGGAGLQAIDLMITDMENIIE